MPGGKYPIEDTLVSDTEQFVGVAAKTFAQDALDLRDRVIGKSKRPLFHEPLNDKEAYVRYKLMREADQPAAWAEELASGDQGDVLNRWAKYEERYRQDLADANQPFPGEI